MSYPHLNPYNFQMMPFPLFQNAINESESNTQAPLGMVIFTALSAIAVSSQGLIDVCLPTGSVVPTSLMIMVIANSGERKSTVENKFLSDIRLFEKTQNEEYQTSIVAWKDNEKLWDAKGKALLKVIQNKINKAEPVNEDETVFLAHQQYKPNCPRKLKILYEDVTAQALFLGLKKNAPVAGLVSSEGATILGGSVFNDLSKLNAIWSGDSITVDRASTESFYLEGGRLSILAMLQPAALKKYIESRGEQARGSGLLARFLVCSAGTTQGTRFLKNMPISWSANRLFNQRICEVLNKYKSTYQDEYFERKIVRFSHEAAVYWTNFYNETESNINVGGRYAQLGDHASKLAENVARVAALLHFFEGFDGDISVTSLHAAIMLCDNSSKDFADIFNPISQDCMDAQLLDEWLNAYRAVNTRYVNKNTIRQKGPNILRDRNRLNMAIEVLKQHGRVNVIKDNKTYLVDVFPWLLGHH